MKQCAALIAEITTIEQRLECIHVSGLHRGVVLVEKIILASSNPRAVGINAQYPNTAPLKSISRDAFSQNLPLGIRQKQSRLDHLLFGGGGLDLGSLIFLKLSPFCEVVDHKPADDSDDIAKDGNPERDINRPSWIWWVGWHWYH